MNASIELTEEQIESMADMTPYRDWSPMPHDTKGLGIPDFQDWLVCPEMIHRETLECSLELSNYEVLLQRLRVIDGLAVAADIDWSETPPLGYEPGSIQNSAEETGQDYIVACFSHWAVGWINIVLVRPNTACHRIAAEARADIMQHPVLDEDDWGEREHEWKYNELPDYVENLKEDVPDDWVWQVMQKMHSEDIHGDGSISWSHNPQDVAVKLGFAEGVTS